MNDYDLIVPGRLLDPNDYAAASFLARYRDMTLRAYKSDLLAFFRWCSERQLVRLEAQHPHLELYRRWMEQRGYAPATMGRRFGTVAGFYKFAVIDGQLVSNPALAVTRPKVGWESQQRTVLHPLEYAAPSDCCPQGRRDLARPCGAAGDARPAHQRSLRRRRERPELPLATETDLSSFCDRVGEAIRPVEA